MYARMGLAGGLQRHRRIGPDGVVTLTGLIELYTGKLAAERAVKRARAYAPLTTICRSHCGLKAPMRISLPMSSGPSTSAPLCRRAYKPWSTTAT